MTKLYGANTVLRDISLQLHKGECIALLGENGAGKSTLVKILSGETQPTHGRILMSGRPIRFADPRAAQAAGVAVIPQELADCPDQTVAENILLGRWPAIFGFTSLRSIKTKATQLLSQFGIKVDCSLRMSELTLAQRQLIAIARALSANAQLLLLDEPTASLNSHETTLLLETLVSIKRAGTTLIYISHRLDECFRISDRIVVLRNGSIVAQQPSVSMSTSDVVNAMLGRKYQSASKQSLTVANDRPLFEAISWSSRSAPRLVNASFAVRSGEILGIFGLIGSGVEAIVEGFGAKPRSRLSGNVIVDGISRRIFRGPFDARRLGIYYVPADRKGAGLALCRPIQEQITALRCTELSALGIVRSRLERRLSISLINEFDVRCTGPLQQVGQLSGGNQQKVLVASRIAAKPKLLVLHEPTQGVDIGARSQIHQLVIDAASEGLAIIVATSDLAEAVTLADRLIVVRDGQIVRELINELITEDEAMAAASARRAS